ncbi:MAG: SCO family protein [Gemmatimonadota bacterium]|jgi:cytochrome oxidase Cu insertion factor (SCO1/SenC/PrrC family)
MGMRILQVAAGLVLGLALVLVAFPLLTRDEVPHDPHVLPTPYPAPSLELTDQDGVRRDLPGDFDGLTAVFFGYTHCPDVCPITMGSLAAVRERLEPEEAERFRVVLVSVDPARDTPKRLGDWLARFDSTFIGLTGSEEEVREVADAWGAWAERASSMPIDDEPASGDAESPAGPAGPGVERAGPSDSARSAAPGVSAQDTARAPEAADPAEEGYIVDHTARTFLVGPRGRIVATFPQSTAPDVMLPTVRRLLEEKR